MSYNTMVKAKDVVLEFLRALNSNEFETARKLLHEDMKFIGVLGTRDSADSYMEDMKKMKLKYSIRKALEDEENVCVFYDIDMGGKKVLSSGWYQVEEGKIRQFTVLFDPRPLLEQK